jgi:hypothetical protein
MEASYEKAKRSHEAHLPRLRDSDARIVEDLKKSAVSITSLEAMGLEGADALLADAYALVARHSPWTRSFQADGVDIVAHDKIIRWGLSDRLLDIAENYLGVPTGYDGINVFFTKADGMEAGARRWHRDAEDRRMLKSPSISMMWTKMAVPCRCYAVSCRIMTGWSEASFQS